MEIREAVDNRIEQLKARQEGRNESLEKLMSNKSKLRSYLIRIMAPTEFHGPRGVPPFYSKEDISSEEKEEMKQVCRRIYELEQEIHRLTLIRTHLKDDQVFDLPFEELVAYGFDSEIMAGE